MNTHDAAFKHIWNKYLWTDIVWMNLSKETDYLGSHLPNGNENSDDILKCPEYQ